MRDKAATSAYYIDGLGFRLLADFGDYLMLGKDSIEVHFFLFKALDPKENYGQMNLHTNDIETLYRSLQLNGVAIHPNGGLATKPWEQKEFSLLDPDHNLLTFGNIRIFWRFKVLCCVSSIIFEIISGNFCACSRLTTLTNGCKGLGRFLTL